MQVGGITHGGTQPTSEPSSQRSASRPQLYEKHQPRLEKQNSLPHQGTNSKQPETRVSQQYMHVFESSALRAEKQKLSLQQKISGQDCGEKMQERRNSKQNAMQTLLQAPNLLFPASAAEIVPTSDESEYTRVHKYGGSSSDFSSSTGNGNRQVKALQEFGGYGNTLAVPGAEHLPSPSGGERFSGADGCGLSASSVDDLSGDEEEAETGDSHTEAGYTVAATLPVPTVQWTQSDT